MALFVVQHQHSADTCPARDPGMGGMLLQHLSVDNARRYDVDILGDAVVNGEHTFYLIAEAPSQERLQEYMAPFTQAGSVQIMPASHCETVVGRGGC